MAARRSTGPAGLRNAGGRGGLLVRRPVTLGDGQGQSTVSRWAMAVCEEFVHKLYRALRGAVALITAFCITDRGDKPQPSAEASTSRSQQQQQHGRLLAPVDASRKQNSNVTIAKPVKRSSRQALGPEACAASARRRVPEPPSSISAASRMVPTAATLTTPLRRNSVTRRMPAPPTTAATTPLVPARTGENGNIWQSRCKLTSSRLTSPKASASAPTPTSPKNSCPAPVSCSSDALTMTVREESMKCVPASDSVRLYKQTVELFKAVVLVLKLLASLAASLVFCVVRGSAARIFNTVARCVFTALLLI